MVRRWLDQSFYGLLGMIPQTLRAKREDPQMFHDLLRYWWRRCEDEGTDLGLRAIVPEFVEEELVASEAALLDEDSSVV